MCYLGVWGVGSEMGEGRRQVGDAEGSIWEGSWEMLGAAQDPISDCPKLPKGSRHLWGKQRSPSWPTDFAIPVGLPGPGLLEECRLSRDVVAIGSLAQDQKCPQALMEGRNKHLESRPLTTLLSYFTAALASEDPGAGDSREPSWRSAPRWGQILLRA